MTTIKMNISRTLIFSSLALLALFTSCKESKKDVDVNTSSKVEKKETNAPEVDIQVAILSNNIDAVKQHIEAGTDLNTKDAMSGSTPLITASSFGKNEIAQLLINAGVDLSVKNNDGATALHTAAFFCRTEIVQMLIKAKADMSLRNNFGATPKESVMGAFEEVKPVYQMLQQQLQPMGLQIDLDHIEKTRPIIAEMLQ